MSATANKRILVSDYLNVINLLAEDTSPDGTADFLVSYDTSGTSAKKVKPANLPVVLPRGYIDGCVISNGTDTVNDINRPASADSTNTQNITVAMKPANS